MRFFGSPKRKPGWLCINLLPDRVDVSHVVVQGKARPEVLLCDSYRKEGDDLATLRRLRRELDLPAHRITTLLKAGDYQVVQVEAPPNVPAAELKHALRWRLKDLIDFPVEAAVVDAVTIPPGAGAAARTPQALAVVARNDIIRATVQPFSDADIPLAAIDIPEMAQRNVAHRLEEAGRGMALLSFDGSGGLLTFTCDGELYQYRNIEQTLDSFVNIDAEQRQQLYERIVLELQRSLDGFDRRFHHVAVSKVVMTPVPGAEDLQEYLAANLGVPLTLLDLAQIMDFPLVPELRQPLRQAQCLKLIGGAMRGETA
ncbi:MAG: type IV pilus biogenesis protein PilM [Burkholderiales bacterium]